MKSNLRVYPWKEFIKQLDDLELGFFLAARDSAKRGFQQEVRIGPSRWAVGINVVVRLKPLSKNSQPSKLNIVSGVI